MDENNVPNLWFHNTGTRLEIAKTYIVTDRGSVFVQLPADNAHRFSIHDEDQEWPGGLGLGTVKWVAVSDDDPRITIADRERLQWILDEARQEVYPG